MSLSDLSASLQFDLKPPYFLVTYHSITHGEEDPAQTFSALLEALDQFPDYHVILTYPNADNGGRVIIPLLEGYAQAQPSRVLAIPSLGFRCYLGALSGTSVMVGNSSSGIIEAPSFGVPTVNIGQRQQGRFAAASVIHCGTNAGEIRAAIDQALTAEFAQTCRVRANPYGMGNAAKQIVDILDRQRLFPAKHFHDVCVQA